MRQKVSLNKKIIMCLFFLQGRMPFSSMFYHKKNYIYIFQKLSLQLINLLADQIMYLNNINVVL